MDVEYKMLRNTLLVKIKGEFDMNLVDNLRMELDEKIEKQRVKNIIFNLEKVSFIDSSGLGVIIGRYKKAIINDINIYIVGAKPSVEKILIFSGINKLIPIFKREQDIVNQ